jgi:iron(III) transport system substrate-binding protein
MRDKACGDQTYGQGGCGTMRAIVIFVVGKAQLFVLLSTVLSAVVLLDRPTPAATVEEAINSLKGLSPEARRKKLEEGSKSESKPAFYHTVIVEDAREILAGFKRKYPFIDYATFRLGNVRLVGKIAAKAKAGRHEADVIQTSGLFGHQLIQQGLVAKYSSPETQWIPAEFVDQTGYWTAFQHIPVLLGFNTRMVKPQEVTKSYEEILDPKWRGHLVLDSDDQDMLAGLADSWGEERAKTFFRGLGTNRAALPVGEF